MIIKYFEKIKLRASIFFIIICLFGWLMPLAPLASQSTQSQTIFSNQNSITNQADTVGVAAGYFADFEEGRLVLILTWVLSFILSFLGAAFLILIIYAGWLWMTAGGNEEQLGKAKKILKEAAIGLLIIFAAYAIVYTVINLIGGPTGQGVPS